LKTPAGDSPFILPASTETGVISGNTMLFALYRMGYRGHVTVHGFRGLASTVLHEKGWETDWIELQLAHVPSGVRARYNVARHLEGRLEMMNLWSTFLAAQDAPTSEGEIPMFVPRGAMGFGI
jgi:integrase